MVHDLTTLVEFNCSRCVLWYGQYVHVQYKASSFKFIVFVTFKGCRRQPAAFTLILTLAFPFRLHRHPLLLGAFFCSSATSIVLYPRTSSGSSAFTLSSMGVSLLGYLYLDLNDLNLDSISI